MKLKPIIKSLLETDMYKFSMGQAIYHQFPNYTTTWSFKCRNKAVKFTEEMLDEIKRQINYWCKLHFKEKELQYLGNIRWIKPDYINFLRLWHPRFNDFEFNLDEEGNLDIEFTSTWLNASMYEIPTMAIINEVYFKFQYDYDEIFESFKRRLAHKCSRLHNQEIFLGNFSEFGLRRRLSAEAQELAITELMKACGRNSSNFVGTSNVYLAMKLGITPVGTMAHEWIMCVGQGNPMHNPAYSNWYALYAWVKEYQTLNGIALTDTIGSEAFRKDFDLTFATLFSGVRHDSGDPFKWGEDMIAHYESLGINPKTKTLLFSDSLNFDKASELWYHFHDRINVAFGIGTYISNDTDVDPLNIVIKVTKCNGMDVAKLSDAEGKGMCKNPLYVEYLKKSIAWRLNNIETVDFGKNWYQNAVGM